MRRRFLAAKCCQQHVSSETTAQAREPLDVTAMQQKWAPEPQWAGDTWPRHSGWHWPAWQTALENVLAKAGDLSICLGIPRPGAEKAQLPQNRAGCKEHSQDSQD